MHGECTPLTTLVILPSVMITVGQAGASLSLTNPSPNSGGSKPVRVEPRSERPISGTHAPQQLLLHRHRKHTYRWHHRHLVRHLSLLRVKLLTGPPPRDLTTYQKSTRLEEGVTLPRTDLTSTRPRITRPRGDSHPHSIGGRPSRMFVGPGRSKDAMRSPRICGMNRLIPSGRFPRASPRPRDLCRWQ